MAQRRRQAERSHPYGLLERLDFQIRTPSFSVRAACWRTRVRRGHNHDRRRGSGTRPRCRVLDIHGGCYRLRQKRQEAFHSRVNILVYRRQGWSTTQPTAGIPQKIHSGPAPTCLMRTESTDNARRVRYCGLGGIVRHQLLRVSSILPERLGRSPVGPVNQLGRNGFRRQGHHGNNSGEITPRDSRERAFPVPHAPQDLRNTLHTHSNHASHE